MKTKRTMLLILISLVLVSLVLPACQKKYSLDEEGLLQLQCNASDMEEIIDDVGVTEETEPTETEPEKTEPTETEPEETEPTETTVEETVPETEPTETKPTAAPKPTEPKPTEPKPTADPAGHVAPVVTATAQADGVLVTWEKINTSDFEGYKVVYSASNPNPKYPDDGYYAYITDRNTTSCLVKSSKVAAGEYYFSVTALYSGEKVAGNAVMATMPAYVAPTPDAPRVAPTVSVSLGDNSVTVSWAKITNPDLVGYKVVASINQANPVYDRDGYYDWITNPDTTSCTINCGDGYNGGDVGNFSGGTQYYFSVTAVYGDEWQKVAGNAVQATMPGDPAPVGTYPACDITSASISDGYLNVSWSPTTDATGFDYYKVVVSKSNGDPVYPADGYWAVISDPGSGSTSINLAEQLVKHPEIISGDTLYIRITTVYCENYAHGNVVTVTVP